MNFRHTIPKGECACLKSINNKVPWYDIYSFAGALILLFRLER